MITPHQSRGARGLLDWSQAQLAEKASLSLSHVRNFEKGRSQPSDDALSALRSALEKAGVEFIPGNGKGPGVRIARGSGKHGEHSARVVKAKKRAKVRG